MSMDMDLDLEVGTCKYNKMCILRLTKRKKLRNPN
jgi:hypothetical protein